MAKLPRKFGDYYLLKKIATGGMAEVFLAQARSTDGPDKYVALKLIHPRYQENENFHHMIVEEAKIAIQLTHKNIGQIFDLGHHEKTYFIVIVIARFGAIHPTKTFFQQDNVVRLYVYFFAN